MTLRILGVSGSLRAASSNSALLRAFAEQAPQHDANLVTTTADLPLYNSDLQDERELDKVRRFQRAVGESDAVLVATPEYNFGPPGLLKNAIDWASRPAYRSVFRDKPVGVVSASASAVGGARAQGQLKAVLLGMGSQVFPYPEFLLGDATSKLQGGVLTHLPTIERVQAFLKEFVAWSRRVRVDARTV
jgi:chromate reductase